MRSQPVTVVYKATLYLLLLLATVNRSFAQTNVTIGTVNGTNGGTTYPCPIQDYYEGSRAQYLYRASELTAAGMTAGLIYAIRFNVTNLNGADVVDQYTIKLAATTVTTLDQASWINGAATVYGPVDYQPVAGVNTFTLSTPFLWNGVDNLLVEICNGSPTSDYTNNPSISWTTGLAFNGSHSYNADNLGNLCNTPNAFASGGSASRPVIILNYAPAAACNGTPVAGTTQSSVTNVCMGSSVTLNVTGTSVATGLTYQWQSSTDNVNWNNITGANTLTLTTTQTQSTYYRCLVTCTASGLSAGSTSTQVLSNPAVSGTFTINKNAPAGSGNFTSFNAAYDYIKCGINGPVIFNVVAGSGPYNEQLHIVPVPGASAANTITFNGNANTITFLSNVSNERAVIKLDGADYFTFNNLKIVPQGTASNVYGFGVQLLNNADYNTVNNCTITVDASTNSTSYAGIVVSASVENPIGTGSSQCDNNTFSNNTITGGYYGITVVGSNTVANQNNAVINNKISDFYLYGIYLTGTSGTIVQKNIFSRPLRTGVSEFNGVYVYDLNTKVNIDANRITNPFGGNTASTANFYGIRLNFTDAFAMLENRITNNLIYGINGSGTAYGINLNSSDNAMVYHNTISMDGTTAGNSQRTAGLAVTSGSDGVYFSNNIITVTGGQDTRYCVYYESVSSLAGQFFDKNNYFIIQPNATSFIGYYTRNLATLQLWTATTGLDVNAISYNPFYTDISTGNYLPTNAAINNRGAVVNVAQDILSVNRNINTPDPGAYEFTPPSCVTPPTPGVSTVDKAVVCPGTQVFFGLTGNSTGLTQTYQYQVGATVTGVFTNHGNPLNYPDTAVIASATGYYRVAVTCGANTTYSTPVLLTVNSALPGGTYTIDKTLTTGNGNYASFNDAKAAMMCGIAGPVIFNVVAGRTDYEEQLVLDSIPGVSAINTITFKGNGNKIHFNGSDNNERAVIKLRKIDHVTFDSLKIDATGTGTYSYGVQLVNHADSNTFVKCHIITSIESTSNNSTAIVLNGVDAGLNTSNSTWNSGNTFAGNRVTGGYYSILLMGDIQGSYENTRITGNVFEDYYAAGVYSNYANNLLVEGNSFIRPLRINSTTARAVYLQNTHRRTTVSGNRIANPFGNMTGNTNTFYGIYLTSASSILGEENRIENNIIYNTTGSGSLYGIYLTSCSYVNVYHNSMSMDNAGGNNAYTTRGFYMDNGDNIRFYNNIIALTSTGASSKYGIYVGSGQYTGNNNNIYIRPGVTNANYGFSTNARATLADWQTATSQDAASYNIDPLYADVPGGDLTPVFYQMDNTGAAVGVTTDILHIFRDPNKPDIGAYEINIPLCALPIDAGTAVVTPASGICMGDSIRLNLTDNTPAGKLTYQWQASYSTTGPWITISDTSYVPRFATILGANNYFRCRLVCSGTDTAYSLPAFVNMNAPLMKGLYTIDPAGSGPRNFTSFTAAVTAMECGIAGEVIFDAVPGTYTEQVRMHEVAGASDTSRITFRSQNGDPAGVTLTYAGTAAANYVLKLDSASYVTWKNITITATNTPNGRAVEYAGNTAYDSLLNNKINVPVATTDNTNLVGVFSTGFKGKHIAIKGNTFTNGASAIHFSGTSATDMVLGLVIDSNQVSSVYTNGIYARYINRPQISRNTISLSGTLNNASAHGIYLRNGDTAYRVMNNKVTISNTAATAYGIELDACNGTIALPGLVEANRIIAITGNTGTVYGLANNTSGNNTTRNNVVSVLTTGNISYSLFSSQGGNVNYYNNSFLNASSSANTNIAGYLNHTTAAAGNIRLRNNIFSHEGGGLALSVQNIAYINSDYNTYYTSGATLIRTPAAQYNNLVDWATAADLDISSIIFKPAFASASTLEPDLANPDVWAIHGRGVQVEGNDHDINGQSRPVTLTEGVPDMGAFEFLPTVTPTVLLPIPATPAAGTTQKFMYGSDTVAAITWAPGADVPTGITLKRYSGVVPPNLQAGTNYMYFYTDIDVTGNGNYKFDLQQHYVDSWQGFISKEEKIRLGRTNAADTWLVNDNSTVDVRANIIADSALQYIDKFTGLQGTLPDAPTLPTAADTSSMGTRFWTGYSHHRAFNTDNSQTMVLYLAAGTQAANVIVKINGTSWMREYAVAANTVVTSDIIPKTGLSDARMMQEGLSTHGISIVSDAPIAAYAHQYRSLTSGAALLMPVGTYGYEYRAMTDRQYADGISYSWFYVVADNDNTVVEITPVQPTVGGRAAGVPFTVKLNKGETYQVMGAMKTANEGYDLSGSVIRSIQNTSGKCYPVGVFSGSSATVVGCSNSNGTVSGSQGDNLVQQNLPVQTWGKQYFTATASSVSDPVRLMMNRYRVIVKDPATVVLLNGIPLQGLKNNSYYDFESKAAGFIEADKPVAVAQYFSYSGSCGDPTNGDGEMIYLSALEQRTKKTIFVRNNKSSITANYVTLTIPTQGLSSLLIDNSNIFSYTYNHPYKAGYTIVTKLLANTEGLSTIQSDSAFTAIAYGLGSDVSYGYNAGMQIRNLSIQPAFTNTNNTSGNKNTYTCAGTPFRLTALLPLIPTSLTWELSQVNNLSPNADVTETNPAPADTVQVDGNTWYSFELKTDYTFTQPGSYIIPVKVTHPEIGSCDNSIETYLPVKVIAAPFVDFAVNYSGCISDVAIFNGTATTENNAAITNWKWSFGDGTTASTRNITKQYAAAGTYEEKLQVITKDGCTGDTSKTVVVNEPGVASLTTDTLTVCIHTDVTFTVKDADANTVYNWYNAETGGALLHTGATLEIKDAASPAVYYVETVKGDCAGLRRAPATLLVLPQLAAPVVTVDSIGVDLLRFSWKAISGATGYLVSTDNGTTWTLPSSGEQGLEHLLTGLKPQQTVTLLVKATGCEDKVSEAATGKTLPDGVYIPSGFTPNGDGLNDMFQVYGAVVREVHLMVFSQWGQKIFESNSQSRGWDGSYQGKAQPSGVYIYICKLKLADGTSVERKGTINLLR
ncbi:Ig-like domain-containing protein [Chitinophaga tropicalis]|nr:gliding motility-associated C-terminal domain-containing protein [Chitinophaga tropicalis]